MASKPTRAQAQRASRVIKLASSPSRAHILLVLGSRSGLPVQTIADTVRMTHSAVSHQLGLLLAAKVVACKKEGRTVRYSLSSSPESKALLKFLAALS
jgi:ArsR family transcriptional regulator, lead/cadmium/zinc/bismuth-responsive transcriptional repressor